MCLRVACSELAHCTVIHSVCVARPWHYSVSGLEELNNWQSPADYTNVSYILKTLKICGGNSNHFPK